MGEQLLTLSEVANLLGVTTKAVVAYTRVSHDPLPGLKLGTGPKAPWRFRLDEVEGWLERCRVSGSARQAV